jgi:hypothetical protein
MKNSRLIQKLTLLTLVSLMISGITVGVLGTKTEKIRPIEEWGTVNNDLAWWGVPTNVGNMFGVFVSAPWYGPYAPPDVSYDGFVLEKENSDGSLDVVVNLHIHNLPIALFDAPLWEWRLMFGGLGEVFFYLKFKMDIGFYGDPLPTFGEIWWGIGAQMKSIHFIASGEGDYFEYGADISEPVPAKLSFKGLGLVKPDMPEGHPLGWYLPSGDTIIYPGEFVKIHTI